MELTRSPLMNAALLQYGIVSERDVLEHIPRRYENYALTPAKAIYEDKERVVVYGRLKGPLAHPLRFGARVLYRFYFESQDGASFLVEAWNRRYLGNFLEEGASYTLVGIYEKRRHALALVNIVKGPIDPRRTLRPVYSLPASVSMRTYLPLLKRCFLDAKGRTPDVVPPEFSRKYRLLSHFDALYKAHFPSSYEDVHQALRTLKYEDALVFSLATQMARKANKSLRKDRRRRIDQEKLGRFVASLPYKMTPDQSRAVREALADMDSPSVMYRLLQGDVGTGKTLVAGVLSFANYTRSEQTAFLVPTDTLAHQHYETLCGFFKGTNVRVGLLVGSLAPAERSATLRDIADGTIDVVVGTHALFSKGVEYAYLGLAIIDEQHKFGVDQRSRLLGKGEHADLLLMSATPIPRTLTLTIYGDLDVSSLSSFPSGKRQVGTFLVKPGSALIKKTIDGSLESGHRVFIVAPTINGADEDSSVLKRAAAFKRLYPGKVTMMHGRMDPLEKEAASLAFRTGLCPILVATSLVEVGLDVKEADAMVVYDPTHFSLSSLHQLRGRIGRDGSPASFIMVSEEKEEDVEKLSVLLHTEDGFKIAEEDLRLRGPGEIAGTKQSGLPDFRYANVISDFKIFECARDDAASILASEGRLEYGPISERAKKESKGSTLA